MNEGTATLVGVLGVTLMIGVSIFVGVALNNQFQERRDTAYYECLNGLIAAGAVNKPPEMIRFTCQPWVTSISASISRPYPLELELED